MISQHSNADSQATSITATTTGNLNGGGGGGVTSGGCCIGGKKVEAMAVVIVDGRVGGTRWGLAPGFDDDEDVDDEDVLFKDFDAGT